MPGWPELIVLIVIILLLFGPKKLPKLARSVGESIQEVKKGMQGLQDEVNEVKNEVRDQVAIDSDLESKPNRREDRPDSDPQTSTGEREPAEKE